MEVEALIPEREWLALQFDALPVAQNVVTPSTWAEANRYLPPSATPMPGYYRYKVAPYLREIVDCLSVDSPVREVTLQKGVQLGATVGILENAIGYYIAHVGHAPIMLLTADAELAKLRLDTSIIPMIQLSGLAHLIKSSDEFNARKTGKTDQKIEIEGGGFILPFGAKSATKLRAIPIKILLRDEVDGYPLTVGKDGDPMKLSADRTAAYEGDRKTLNISTPTIVGQSRINECFERGDKRRYFVRCLKCNAPQTLRWRRENRDTGEVTGIVWETKDGNVVPESVRYLCRECSHPHTNDDKARLLSPEHGAEWRPTAEAADPTHRSYHLSALYSPPGMQTWAAGAAKWQEAWDTERAQPKDIGKLQVFYNNVLGEPFRMLGSSVRFEKVSGHRRSVYHYGQIPNRWASRHCGGHVLALVCTVDVHKDNLAVSVWGWCRGRRVLLVDYWRFGWDEAQKKFIGDTENLDDPATWVRLAALIEDAQRYKADDGRIYPIALTLIDSGYRADDVYRFCAQYETSVFPVKGRDAPPKSANLKEFSSFATPMGATAYGITVDFYKDRWSSALRRGWNEDGIQPEGHFNAPLDATDKQLKELTVETKRERIDAQTGQRLGFTWHRPSGAANELWDCLVYASAAFDIIAWDVCVSQLELEAVNWAEFYTVLEQQHPFFQEPDPKKDVDSR